MSKKIIELFLTADPVLREQCLDNIAGQFKVQRPWQYYKNPPPELSRFFRFETKEDKNVWDLAEDLLKVNGVIEADPVEQTLGIVHPQTGAYDSDDDYPVSTLWNHDATRFTQARQRVDKSAPVTVKIGQLDTGYTFHPGLGARIQRGYDFLDSDDNPFDPLMNGILLQPGHGTATASVIIGNGYQPNPASIQNGVWPDVPFQAFRIARSVIHVFHSYISDAICKAVDMGCNVITMSMGGAPPRRSWLEAVRYAYDRGVIVCCAAGNNVGFVIWPARYTNVIAVGGINVKDTMWEGSCHGEDVDVSAPGENVYVAQTSRTEDDSQAFLNTFGSGTSFATPHVAAAAAMWLHHFRNELAGITGSARVEAFRQALDNSVRKPSGWDASQLGKGILDADKLLQTPPALPKSAAFKKLQKTGAMKLYRSGKKKYDGDVAVTMNIRDKEMMHLLYIAKGSNVEERMGSIKKIASDTAKQKIEEISITAQKRIKQAKAGTLAKGGLKKAHGFKAGESSPVQEPDHFYNQVLTEQLNDLVKKAL